MVPSADNLVLGALAALVAIFAGFLLLRLNKRLLANAPPAALRTPAQRRLHLASIATMLVPFGYLAGVDGTHVWPVVAVLLVQVGILAALQGAKVGYRVRLWLIGPVAVGATVAGVVASAWPLVDAGSMQDAPWPLLAASAAAFAVAGVLSIYSFPVGYGERAH